MPWTDAPAFPQGSLVYVWGVGGDPTPPSQVRDDPGSRDLPGLIAHISEMPFFHRPRCEYRNLKLHTQSKKMLKAVGTVGAEEKQQQGKKSGSYVSELQAETP